MSEPQHIKTQFVTPVLDWSITKQGEKNPLSDIQGSLV